MTTIDEIRLDINMEMISANFRNICNDSDPGYGKTYATIKFCQRDVHHNAEHHWIIAVPTIKLAEDLSVDYDIPVIYGKEKALQDGPITFSNTQCYLDGCSKCDDRDECAYQHQPWEAPILLMAYETVQTMPTHIGVYDYTLGRFEVEGWYGLVVEEEPMRYWYGERDITEFVNDGTIILDDAFEQTVWNNLSYKFYHSVIVHDGMLDATAHLSDYLLLSFLKGYSGLEAHEYKNRDGETRFTLIGHKNYMKPAWVERVVYNDATMVKNQRDVIFGPYMGWVGISKKNTITNPICRFGYRWGETNTGNNIEHLITMVNEFHKLGKKCLIITKKALKKDILHADIVHYGNSRGFNSNFKEYDLVIVFGSFYWPPEAIAKHGRLGIGEDVIHEIEEAEIIQAVNRFRPALQPDIPIILMTQDIKYESDIVVMPSVLKVWAEYPLTESHRVGKLIDGQRKLYYSYKQFVSWVQQHVMHILTDEDKAINFLKEGMKVKDIIKHLGLSRSTVYRLKKSLTIFGEQE